MEQILNAQQFCTSRDNARAVAKELNGKVVDNGKDAPKGERWEVQYHVEVVGKQRSILKLARASNGHRKVHHYVHNNNQKKTTVPVYKKPSLQMG